MSNYKVGDLASLMSSNKSGNKLQTLFNEHWNKRQSPNMFKNVKNMKTQSKNASSDCDVVSNVNKKTKKKKVAKSSSTVSSPPCSPMKEVKTDLNSDFLTLSTKKKHFKGKNVNSERKRKSSFSNNPAEENKKQNVEHSKDVKGFIRCSKNKRQKTAKRESVDAISIEPVSVKENLFSESVNNEDISNHQSKKKKTKKSKSFQSSSSVPPTGVSAQPDEDTIGIEPVSVKENLFSESVNSENISNHQSRKKKTKKSRQSFQSSLTGASAQPDKERSKMDAEDSIKDLPRTLFIGNLPVSVNRKMLHKLFVSFGQIKSVRLRGAVSSKVSIPKKVAEIKSEYHKGLQSHTGFVVFKEEESAKNALSLNGTLIDNHHIVVDFASQAGEKKLYSNDSSIFLGNLPFDIDDEAVRSAFEDCGDIQAVRIIRDRDTGLGKGFGFVQFQKIKSKDKALTLEDLKINGRTIRIKPIDSDCGKKADPKKTVMMIRNNMATKRIKEFGNKKSVKKLLKKGKRVHQKKRIARLLGEKFVK